jgi:RND family efflux transporter MFP subunit
MSQDQVESPTSEAEWGRPERGSFPAEMHVHFAPEGSDHLKKSAPVRAGRAVLLLAVAAIAVAFTGISERRIDAERLARWTDEQAIPTVALVAPQRGGAEREVVLPGDVQAFFDASIHGQVSGYVREWRKDIGAKVRRGDVLAVVDTPELDQRISVAESELSKAEANQKLAHVTAQRWNSLRNSAAVSQQAVDEKQSDANAKDAEVQAAQANVDRLKALKTFANIVAPFDGVVTARNVDVGSFVSADSKGPALFKVADIHQMRIYVRAPESYAAALKEGLKATLDLPEYPGHPFEARVETSSHAIDEKSRSLLIELIADNPDGRLSPGAFARVHFQIPPDPDAVRIPASALLFRDNAVQIATLGMDNRIKLRKIRIARDFGSDVEIAGSLNLDERLVANPPDSIDEGEKVRVMDAATEKSSAPEGRQGAQSKSDGRSSAGNMAQTGRERGE